MGPGGVSKCNIRFHFFSLYSARNSLKCILIVPCSPCWNSWLYGTSFDHVTCMSCLGYWRNTISTKIGLKVIDNCYLLMGSVRYRAGQGGAGFHFVTLPLLQPRVNSLPFLLFFPYNTFHMYISIDNILYFSTWYVFPALPVHGGHYYS